MRLGASVVDDNEIVGLDTNLLVGSGQWPFWKYLLQIFINTESQYIETVYTGIYTWYWYIMYAIPYEDSLLYLLYIIEICYGKAV